MPTRTIYCGDNLAYLRKMPDECIDLIYVDPPSDIIVDYGGFSSSVSAKMEKDALKNVSLYIKWMKPRIQELWRVLKSTGSLYFHCDWQNDAYIRVMLDRIFGPQNLQSHIIWRRRMPQAYNFPTFQNNHDSIFFYTKTSDFVFHRQFIPHDESKLADMYKYTESETGRRYRLIDLTNSRNDRPNLTYQFLGITRAWKWTQERMEQAYKQGLIVQTRPGSVPALKLYLDEQAGIPIDNVWLDVTAMATIERQGYLSQKPLALLDRIIQTSSQSGDIVLDAFSGTGTTLLSAQKSDRHWVGIDINPTACRMTIERLERECKLQEGKDFFISGIPDALSKISEYTPLDFESWVVLALRLVLKFEGVVTSRVKVQGVTLSLKTQLASLSGTRDDGFDFVIGENDDWIPAEIKRKSIVTNSDIARFTTSMRRHNRDTGLFIALDFSKEVKVEIERFQREERLKIVPISVKEIIHDLKQQHTQSGMT